MTHPVVSPRFADTLSVVFQIGFILLIIFFRYYIRRLLRALHVIRGEVFMLQFRVPAKNCCLIVDGQNSEFESTYQSSNSSQNCT